MPGRSSKTPCSPPGVALLIIIVFISLVFKRKRSIPLIVTPVLFGGLFALCFIYFIKGEISAIAVGAGSAVHGNCVELFHSYSGAPEPRFFGAAITQRAYLPAHGGKFHYHRSLLRAYVYKFGPAARLRLSLLHWH